jgi:phosphomannomutase
MAQAQGQVSPKMTPGEMRAYYLEQTRLSLEKWEADNGSISQHPPFALHEAGASHFVFTPEVAQRINLRQQIDEFAEEAKVSTAGVRENQNVLCSWDPRYRINQYIFALLAESLARLVKELQPERVAGLPPLDLDHVRTQLGAETVQLIEGIFERPLGEAIEFARTNPLRMVGGEVRSNTPQYVGLMSRIYAARGLHVFVTADRGFGDTSTIFMWSFLVYLLGMSGGDYFTSSHGAPQKQSDKILAPDGAQYLPPLYARIVEHLYAILAEIESGGYTVRLAALDDPHLHYTLTYDRTAKLYANYLRQGPASPAALHTIGEAIGQGLRLQLDFFGGAGYRTIYPVLQELGIDKAFLGGLLRCEEDAFFHNVGFRVGKKKGTEEYEVVHDSVDASLPIVVQSAGYDELLENAPDGQMIFNVDPDSDRFVVGQLVPATEKPKLDELGITSLPMGGRLFALYSPNQFFLLLAENDRVVAMQDGSWQRYSNFDVHTYVSALSWDEWAARHDIPVVRVPVGFKEIAAVIRQVEEGVGKGPIEITNELGETVSIGSNPKLHHAGEESGGKIGGPTSPIYNLFGQSVLGMREKSSGEACVSAVSLAARLWLESRQDATQYYLHTYLQKVFTDSAIENRMEFRGDIVHYNEAIFDPKELAQAKKAGIAERVAFNAFFTDLVSAPGDLAGKAAVLAEAMPEIASEWNRLERIDHWSDGLQFWFKRGGKLRDLCLRPSGTDAKTKVYLDGTDKLFLQTVFERGFRNFKPVLSERYRQLVK